MKFVFQLTCAPYQNIMHTIVFGRPYFETTSFKNRQQCDELSRIMRNVVAFRDTHFELCRTDNRFPTRSKKGDKFKVRSSDFVNHGTKNDLINAKDPWVERCRRLSALRTFETPEKWERSPSAWANSLILPAVFIDLIREEKQYSVLSSQNIFASELKNLF